MKKSPFEIFRRNQKIMIAVLGLLAMIAFVFLDPLMRLMGDPGEAQNPVIVETNFGNLDLRKLQTLVESRKMVDQFLRRLAPVIVEEMIKGEQLNPAMADFAAQRLYLSHQQVLLDRSRPEPEAAAVETLVLAHRAEELGMVISDEAINDFLRDMTQNMVSGEKIEEIIAGLGGQSRVSEKRFFDAFRRELMALKLNQMFRYGLNTMPPGQLWDYFARLNREATIQAIPVQVADFISKVKDPSEEDLRSFYEQWRNSFAVPGSPDPGFKEPKKAKFQYFKAEYDKFVERAKVTDEEIVKYYEENKERFRELNLPDEEKEGSPAPDKSKPATDGDAKPGAEDRTGGAAKSPATGRDDADDGADKNREETAPKDKASSESDSDSPRKEPTSEKPDEDPASDSTDAKADGADDAGDAKPRSDDTRSDDSGARAASAKYRLVSDKSQDENETDDSSSPPKRDDEAADRSAEGEPGPAKSADDTKSSDDKADDDKSTDDKADDDKTADDKATDDKATDDKATDDKPADDNADKAGDPKAEKPKAKEPPPKYEPLEKVREDIRKDLAGQKARQAMDKAIGNVMAELQRIKKRRILADTKAKDVEFPREKLQSLAEENQLGLHETELVSQLEAQQQTDVGKSYDYVADPSSRYGVRREFVQLAFHETFPESRPQVTQDDEGNQYAFWKTATVKERVPPLTSIRKEVVRAWKMVQARRRASEQAEKYAETARKAKKPLAEVFANRKDIQVIKEGPFAWMTMGSVAADPGSAQPRLTQLEKIEDAGPDFMQKVFSMSVGDVSVAMNRPQTIAYAVQAMDFDPPLEELDNRFVKENPNRYGALANDDIFRIYFTWLRSLEREAGVRWLRPIARQNGNEAA